MRTKRTNLVYKRAYSPEMDNFSLEDELTRYFQLKPSLRDRGVSIDLLSKLVVSRLEHHPQNNGIFLRAYVVEEGAIGIIPVDVEGTEADLVELIAPANHRFLKREIVLYVRNNEVIARGIDKRNGSFSQWLSRIFDDEGSAPSIRLEDVPSQATLAEIRSVGVRQVEFGISEFMEGVPASAASKLNPILRALLAKPASLPEARKRAQAVGKVVLSRGRFLKQEQISRDDFVTEVAAQVYQHGTDDYIIRLENNKPIRANAIVISKVCNVPVFANSVSYDRLKEEILQYVRELRQSGEWGG